MLILTLHEFIRWTGLTVFELWLHLVAVFFSTVLLAVKIHLIPSLSYWFVCSPSFIACGLDGYYLFIVFVRSIIEYKDCKGPVLRYFCNTLRLALIVSFELLLCYKIEGDLEQGQVATRYSYGIVFMPVWLMLTALTLQTCRLF